MCNVSKRKMCTKRLDMIESDLLVDIVRGRQVAP